MGEFITQKCGSPAFINHVVGSQTFIAGSLPWCVHHSRLEWIIKKVMTKEKDNWGVIGEPYGFLKIHKLKSPTLESYNKKFKNQFFTTVQY